MSLAEIKAELPKLTHQERREVARVLIEVEDEDGELMDSVRAADAAFLMLDKMEEEDASAAR